MNAIEAGSKMEYKDTLCQLLQEEELEALVGHNDEFRNNGAEIVVYEADSDNSECGSEDVEILTHRYDTTSGTRADDPATRVSGRGAINRLSLATEMLRTDQDLPYDAQFRPLLSPDDKDGKTVPQNAGESFILRKYYESLAASVRAGRRQQDRKAAPDSGVHSDESDQEDGAQQVSFHLYFLSTLDFTWANCDRIYFFVRIAFLRGAFDDVIPTK